LFSAKFDARFV